MIRSEINPYIPPALRAGSFCAWRYLSALPSGKIPKAPFDPRNGFKLKPNRPTTWLSIGSLIDSLTVSSGSYAGIGRLCTYPTDQIISVDIDDCFLDAGELKPWAAPYALSGSYTEISPSGRGLRVFVRGELPADIAVVGSKKIHQKNTIPGSPDSEVMISLRSVYVTLTGRQYGSATDVALNQPFVDSLVAPILASGKKCPKKKEQPQHHKCELFLAVTPVVSPAEIDSAIELLSRPEVDKFFGPDWTGSGTRKDQSPSGMMATIISACSRVGYSEAVARRIWEKWCDLHSHKFRVAQWWTSWEKLNPQNHNHCELFLSVTFSENPTLENAIDLVFPDSYSLSSRIQAIFYRCFSAGLSESDAVWAAGQEICKSGEDLLILPHHVTHWSKWANTLLNTHSKGFRNRKKRGPSEQVQKGAALRNAGKSAKEIAEETGIAYSTVKKQISRAKQYGLLTIECSIEVENPNTNTCELFLAVTSSEDSTPEENLQNIFERHSLYFTWSDTGEMEYEEWLNWYSSLSANAQDYYLVDLDQQELIAAGEREKECKDTYFACETAWYTGMNGLDTELWGREKEAAIEEIGPVDFEVLAQWFPGLVARYRAA